MIGHSIEHFLHVAILFLLFEVMKGKVAHLSLRDEYALLLTKIESIITKKSLFNLRILLVFNGLTFFGVDHDRVVHLLLRVNLVFKGISNPLYLEHITL